MARERVSPLRFRTTVAKPLSRCRNLVWTVRRWMADRYRPELHYMRGPGPKTLAKLERTEPRQ